jgi:hypothetical protein
MFCRLRAGAVLARETAKNIAAGPIVEKERKLCFSRYNTPGDCIVTSTGIIIHVVGTMGVAIKHIVIEEAATPEYPVIHDFESTSRGSTRPGLAFRRPNATMARMARMEGCIDWPMDTLKPHNQQGG